MSKRRLSRLEIKQAILSDRRFRELFPELQDRIAAVLNNPSCACNVPIYDEFFKFKDRLAQYFSGRDVVSPKEEAEEENQNRWSVINCKIDELETVLNKMHKIGRVQVAVARYQDQATVIVNDPGVII